jgi:hypothetical protein
MCREGGGQFRALLADLAAEHLLDVAVLLDEALHALLEPAALWVEVVLERGGKILVDFAAGLLKRMLQVEQQPLAFVLDRVRVDLSACMPQRKQADPQGSQRVFVALPPVAFL